METLVATPDEPDKEPKPTEEELREIVFGQLRELTKDNQEQAKPKQWVTWWRRRW